VDDDPARLMLVGAEWFRRLPGILLGVFFGGFWGWGFLLWLYMQTALSVEPEQAFGGEGSDVMIE